MKQRVSRNAKVISISMILSSAIIAGGIAYASGDAFTACVNKNTGLTRIISGKMKCYKSERQVTWNQSGPTGSQGATGSTGSNGYSNVYVKSDGESVVGLSQSSPSSTVLSLTGVPAGSYVISVSYVLDQFTRDANSNDTASTNHSYIDCAITSANTWASRTNSNSIYPLKTNSDQGVLRTIFLKKTDTNAGHGTVEAANGVVTLTDVTTINLLCNYEDDNVSGVDGVYVRYPSLTLIQVNNVNRQ